VGTANVLDDIGRLVASDLDLVDIWSLVDTADGLASGNGIQTGIDAVVGNHGVEWSCVDAVAWLGSLFLCSSNVT